MDQGTGRARDDLSPRDDASSLPTGATRRPFAFPRRRRAPRGSTWTASAIGAKLSPWTSICLPSSESSSNTSVRRVTTLRPATSSAKRCACSLRIGSGGPACAARSPRGWLRFVPVGSWKGTEPSPSFAVGSARAAASRRDPLAAHRARCARSPRDPRLRRVGEWSCSGGARPRRLRPSVRSSRGVTSDRTHTPRPDRSRRVVLAGARVARRLPSGSASARDRACRERAPRPA